MSEYRYLARFERDGSGYVLPDGFSPGLLDGMGNEPRWVETTIGNTSRRAWVNLARAYVVEPIESRFVEVGWNS